MKLCYHTNARQVDRMLPRQPDQLRQRAASVTLLMAGTVLQTTLFWLLKRLVPHTGTCLNPLGNVAVYCLLRAKLLFQVAPEFHVADAGMVNAQVGSPPARAFFPVLRVRQGREPSKAIVAVRHPPMMDNMVVAEYFACPG